MQQSPPTSVSGPSSARAWRSAIELTARIVKNPARILPAVIEEIAQHRGDAPALLSDRECMTWRALAARSNQYARWSLELGLGKGDVVCLMMPNRPEYMAIWLGVTRTGCTVALLNTNLTGCSLAHCIHAVEPAHVIVAAEFVERLSALPDIRNAARIHVHGGEGLHRLDLEIERHSGDALHDAEHRQVTIEDRALLIYTSGTTGLPKAAIISHARIMQWSHWFAGMMNTSADDRLYCCLPMYHSVGGVLAPGAVLVAGGSVVLAESFSANRFWHDLIRWDCTVFQYIGELCRYLLNMGQSSHETGHRLRMCCGNGLRSDIWNTFQTRFRIPRILEFYAATEGNVSLFNVEGRQGAVGRIPSYLAHRVAVALVRFDLEKGEPVRDEFGFCIRCAPNEPGEALGRIDENASNAGNRFEGYSGQGRSGKEASEEKILRGVFEPGDAWFRTGDLMRRDEQNYFYFVDRIGDTFRWKGENVATTEVAAAICAFPGVHQANVYGVAIPCADGRAGMAALAAREDLDLAAFRRHLFHLLPEYAHPLFLRIPKVIAVTATFKYTKNLLVSEGYDPASIPDIVYFNHRERGAYVRLEPWLYERIQAGEVKL